MGISRGVVSSCIVHQFCFLGFLIFLFIVGIIVIIFVILFQLLNYSVSMQEFYLFLILLPIPLAGGGEGLQGQVE